MLSIMELLVPVTLAILTLTNKFTSDAAKQEMDRNEEKQGERSGLNPERESMSQNPGDRILRAKEEYFIASLEKNIRDFYPDFTRYEILNRAVYYHNQMIIEVRIYLSNGSIVYRSFNNSELWRVEYIPPEEPIESEPEITEEEKRALIIHEWMSKNVPTLTLKIEKAKANGIRQISYDLPELPNGLTEEEVSSIIGELVPLFDWMITVENNQVNFKDVDVEDDDAVDPTDLFDEAA